MRNSDMRKALVMLAAGVLMATRLLGLPAFADSIPTGWQASNMQPVGYAGLEGRQGFKLVIRQVGGRWYLYSARFGIEILDVTDPTDPKQLKYLPGPPNTAVNQITIHDNLMITGLSRPITPEEGSGRADGWTTLHAPAPAEKAYQEGVLIWDVGDPINPRQISHWEGHASGTHRNA